MENILKAIKALQAGEPIIIVDSYDRENEGDLVVSAQTVTDEAVNFMVMHSSGVICLTMLEEQIEKLKIPMMVSPHHKRDKFETAFAHSIESAKGITTGISAKDRAHTLRVASNPNVNFEDVISPGHVFPLKARKGLLAERKGHTEASVEICLLAGLTPSAAIVEVANPYGGMLSGEELDIFAKTYRLPIISIDDIINYKENASNYVEKYSKSKLPTQFGVFDISVWHNLKKEELVVIEKGDLSGDFVPVRLHSKCLTGDVFHSQKCDCNQQLHSALNYIESEGRGLILYLDQEGRGISLADKIKAYALQEEGYDTIEANLKIGKPVDSRTWDFALAVLKQYNLKSIELLTNNPDKEAAIKSLFNDNFKVKQIRTEVNEYNKKYLETKAQKMKHKILF